MTERLTAKMVIDRARTMLLTARTGLADLIGDNPERRTAGMLNIAVFGRSVTFVLQNLRTDNRERFDAWYAPYEKEMKGDPLLQYFNKLRTAILKEGDLTIYAEHFISRLDGPTLARMQANPPPGATSFFLCDQVGGSGWQVQMPDGRLEKFYVALPDEARVYSTLHAVDPPETHLGEKLVDTSLPVLGRLYVDYLGRLIRAAEIEFAPF